MAVKENGVAKERGYTRIATEEAFNTPEIIRQYEELLKTKSLNDPGFESLEGFYMTSNAERPKQIKWRLQDPKNAVKEIERGAKKLGLKGVIINSHIAEGF